MSKSVFGDLDALLEHADSKFSLVNIVTKRARQLNNWIRVQQLPATRSPRILRERAVSRPRKRSIPTSPSRSRSTKSPKARSTTAGPRGNQVRRRHRCAGSSDTSDGATASRSFSTRCGAWSTAATTAPASRSSIRPAMLAGSKAEGKLSRLAERLNNGERPLRRRRRRAYPLGDARRAVGRQRAPAPGLPRATSPSSTTASSRTTRPCAPACSSSATSSRSETDTEVLAHLIELHYDGDLEEAVRRTAPRGPRRLRARRDLERRSRSPRLRAQRREPARARHRRRRDVRRLRYARDSALHAPRDHLAGGRDRRRRARRISPHRLRRRPHRARCHRHHVGRRLGREDRLQALHAQGDLRAAARDQGDAERPRSTKPAASISATSWADDHAAAPAKHQQDRDHGLRHARTTPEWSACTCCARSCACPVEMELASEFRYGDPVIDPTTLVIAMSQSGETADTIEAVRIAKAVGLRRLGHLQRARLASHAARRRHALHARRSRDRRRRNQDVRFASRSP